MRRGPGLWCVVTVVCWGPYLSLNPTQATADIGVNSHHQRCVLEFLHFARFKRGECLKAVEGAFSDLADSRLVEDTFTCEEVCVCVRLCVA